MLITVYGFVLNSFFYMCNLNKKHYSSNKFLSVDWLKSLTKLHTQAWAMKRSNFPLETLSCYIRHINMPSFICQKKVQVSFHSVNS